MSLPTSAPRVAFQGERGAYSDEAIARHWRGAAQSVPARDCAAVVAAVASAAVDYGVVPVENTLAGSVAVAYDALIATDDVTVVGEVVLPIHHCVLALPGASLDALTVVESHPIALAQCRGFLARHPRIEARPANDTAGAALAVAARGNRAHAAIAGRAAAARSGLVVLATNVEDRADNQTRFLVVARDAAPPPHGTAARTAMVVEVDNVPGALLRLLQPLADAGLNMSKLESRPTGVPWTYQFVLEVEHPAGDATLSAAVTALRRASRSLRVLGTFAVDGAGRA